MPNNKHIDNFFTALGELVDDGAIEAIHENGFQDILHTRMQKNIGVSASNFYEASFVGGGIPDYINPLHVEKNINISLDLLATLDALLNEYFQKISAKTLQNYLAHELKVGSDSEAQKVHEKLSSLLHSIENQRALEYRIANGLLDLFEYVKASKFGAGLVFDIDIDEIESVVTSGDKFGVGLKRIRETLRSLLKIYRKVSLQRQNCTVALSIKHSDVDQQPEGWKRSKIPRRDELPHSRIEFDLRDTDVFENYRNPKINAVGIQVIDKSSGFRNFYPSVERKFQWSTPRQAYWNLSLTDESDGVDLGNQDRFRFEETRFSSVPGSRDSQQIIWSRNESLLNVSPARKWSLDIEEMSHDFQPKKSILDITLFFDISFMN